jgi:rubrerythrin
MRLIDADAFKKYISEGYEERKDDFKTEKYRHIAEEATKGFIMDIDEQETAYDVDKAVEELKELAIEFESSYYVELSHAIDIVKRGGTNAKASEWKVIPGSGGWMIGCFECKNCGHKSVDDKAICPGCGAKMKKVK